ncbi:MAG: TIM barrel protein [Christensenellaceae bacterium]
MIKFGPSGNSNRFYDEGYKSTAEAPLWLKANGLDCFEYSFGRGVNLSYKTANELKSKFEECEIEVSVHAPYFINLANPDDEKAKNSFGYVLSSAAAARALGAKRVIFHPASVGKVSREEAVNLTKERFKILTGLIYENGFEDMLFCPETMGKINQIGTVEEIMDFCKTDNVYIPTVDFGHINARERGSLKTTQDYLDRLNYMIDELGYERMKHFHVHFSKIQYSGMGEVKHLTFEDDVYGPEFYPLSLALHELNLEPIVICESDGTQADDAIFMKKVYFGENQR